MNAPPHEREITTMSNSHNGRKTTNARQQHELRKRRLAAAVRREQRRAERNPGNGWIASDLGWALAQYEMQTGESFDNGGSFGGAA